MPKKNYKSSRSPRKSSRSMDVDEEGEELMEILSVKSIQISIPQEDEEEEYMIPTKVDSDSCSEEADENEVLR